MVYEKYRIELSHYLYDTEKTGFSECNCCPIDDPIFVELTLVNELSKHWTNEEIAVYLVEKLKEVVENGESL